MPSTTDTPAPLVAGQHPGFQTSEACDNPMVEPAKPLPWQVRYGDTVADATGAKVAGCWRPETARMIVDAVNERDQLRDIVRRLIPAVEESFAIAKHEAESIKGICALTNVDSSEVDAVLSQWENLLREARAAIGEDEAEGERHA